MSYTPTPQAEVVNRRPAPDLEDVLAEISERLFVHGQLGEMSLPSALRLGPKTTAAIQQLFTTHLPWFSTTDKVRYLLESRTLRPYRHYWGLLANVFPRPQAQIISDLLSHAQPKLRIIMFLGLIRREDAVGVLSTYFDQYFTSGWRDRGLELFLHAFEDGVVVRPDVVMNRFQACGSSLATSGIRDLQKSTTSGNFLRDFLHGYNKLRTAAQWNPAETSLVLQNKIPTRENRTDAYQFFVTRALLRTSHLVAHDVWSNAWLSSLLQHVEDPIEGRFFAAYAALSKGNLLNDHTAKNILQPAVLADAWNTVTFNRFLNETIDDVHRRWHRNPFRRASNLLRFMIYLRTHPYPNIVHAVPAAKLRIHNLIRYFWRQESRSSKAERVRSLPLGHLVIGWVGRLERYLQTATW
ncbi:MAG: hypothetical protein HY420_03645 [Candidatus Kerfeldbacteria bacterium]|nr:hypothetical protein [Candidatus Kerfeldbacteria bacterium]